MHLRQTELTWNCDGEDIVIRLDRSGNGPTVLLLPALSSISTRCEMRPLMQRLSGSFTTVAIDWPGFGTLPKPYLDWRPAVYEAFLAHVITEVVPDAFGIAAAGHAAGYVIKHFESHDYVARRLVLLSPTWRGPLPTMTGRNSAFFAKIARAFDPPLLGGILYRLNVNRLVIGMMTRGHVYSNPRWLIGGRMEEKLAVTRAPGARHASARFVTGRLDPFDNRQEQMEAARRIAIPTLLMFADTAPPKSRREMQALAALPNVKTVRLTKGKLSFYEEFPEETAAVIGPFLASPASAEPSSDTVTDLL